MFQYALNCHKEYRNFYKLLFYKVFLRFLKIWCIDVNDWILIEKGRQYMKNLLRRRQFCTNV